MRLFRPFIPFRLLYPGAVIRSGTDGRTLCLTFDDGPYPESTPAILEILKSFTVKAVFFCNGRQAESSSGLVGIIREDGHLAGNHGYSHYDGFTTSCQEYIEDVERAKPFTSSEIFRPPFGRMTPCQYRILKKKYRIILWDLMVYDFDQAFGPMKCLNILKKNLHPGSIIVLHDTPHSCAVSILPEFIRFAISEGYRFDQFPMKAP